MITLNELIDIIKETEGDAQKLMEYSPDVLEYMSGVDSAGTNVLGKKSPDYIMGFLAAAESCASSAMIFHGYVTPDEMKNIISNNDVMNFVTLCIKMTIGMMVHEELR